MFRTVVWATDGSVTADEALPLAKAVLEEGGRLVVVHSEELMVGRGAGFPVLADEEELGAKITAQVAELEAEGLNTSFKLVKGASAHAAHMIADVARKLEADVIVAGTRGHGLIAGLIVGSVTQRLLHIAPCPVLVVPTAKQRMKQTGARDHAAVAS